MNIRKKPSRPASIERLAKIRLISDGQHTDELVHRIYSAKVSLWIATANLKDLHIPNQSTIRTKHSERYVSAIRVLADRARTGVEVKILHGSLPSKAFTQQMKSILAISKQSIQFAHCIRVHLKMIAVDGESLYLGSANFTGAGLGAKSDSRRNFEMGIWTDDHLMLDAAQERFDSIWAGQECASCGRRELCPKPLDSKDLVKTS